jgi:hypothetical protein
VSCEERTVAEGVDNCRGRDDVCCKKKKKTKRWTPQQIERCAQNNSRIAAAKSYRKRKEKVKNPYRRERGEAPIQKKSSTNTSSNKKMKEGK